MVLDSRRGHALEWLTALAIALPVMTPGVIGAAGLELVGRGDRLALNETTDVWALGRYAYTGTFGSPCGGTSPDAGVWVWDVSDETAPTKVGVIPSPPGSRSNDVRVASMNSGDILVHSNESCDFGGPGGFEIYDVDDPENPLFLAHVQTDDVNLLLAGSFGFDDSGVHNLFLFTQGEKDYVAATVESVFGNFQIFDITDPTNPTRVGFWGAEQSPEAQVFGVAALTSTQWVSTTDFPGAISPGLTWNQSGFGLREPIPARRHDQRRRQLGLFE